MTAINYRSADVDGVKVFYREAGAAAILERHQSHARAAPAQLLPRGYTETCRLHGRGRGDEHTGETPGDRLAGDLVASDVLRDG